jgi:amino acid transporter
VRGLTGRGPIVSGDVTDTTTPVAGPEGPAEKGLKADALGLLSSVVIGIASVAPAYSLAATLGLVVAAVGLQSPVIMILAFVPMLMVAYAYKELNSADPDCGTTFTWMARAFGPRSGWMGGWAIIAADVIVMANLAQIAGAYGYQLVDANGLAASTFWTTFAGVVWIVAMTVICYLGIEISARIQYALLGIEIVMLAIFSVTALVKTYSSKAPAGSIHVAASWFNPSHIASFSALTSGMLLAVFIYWGWDTAVAVNEETADRKRTPGVAAVLSTLILLGTYVLVTVAAQAFAGVGTTGNGLANSDNSSDVLSILGKDVFGSSGVGTALAKLLVLMVLTSAAASTLTTILPTARTSLSMAAYKALPQRFARIHRRFQTPTWSTVAMGLLSIGFYVLMVRVSKNVLADTIGSIGMLIAFYYGFTGLACVWYFRHRLQGFGNLMRRAVLPGLGGVILLVFFVKACQLYIKPDYGLTSWTMPFAPHWQLGGVFLTGIGSLVLGLVLMLAGNLAHPHSEYFTGQTLPKSTAEADPE